MADDEIPAALSRENSTVMVTERNIKIQPPVFSSSAFESYMEEVTIWRELCGLPNNKQAIFLWYQLPRDDPSDIKAKIMNEVGLDSLKSDVGITKFIEVMNNSFKKQDEVKLFEVYTDFFEHMRRKDNEKINDYINRFDKNAILAKKHNMELPSTVLGLKLLADAGLSDSDRKLVLSEIDFSKANEVYRKAKTGLAKYSAQTKHSQSNMDAIKRDTAFTAQDEEVLIAKGYVKARKQTQKNQAGQSSPNIKKKINPKGENGEILICPSCGSYRHLLADCPDSYENQAKLKSKAFAAEAIKDIAEENTEDAFFTSNFKKAK